MTTGIETLKTRDLKPRIGTEVLADKAALLSGRTRRHIAGAAGATRRAGIPGDRVLRRRTGRLHRDLGTFAPNAPGEKLYNVTLDTTVNSSADYLKGSLYWHIDGTMNEVPIRASLLSSQVLPSDGGGDTEFCNTYAAYDALGDDDKVALDGLTVMHSAWNTLFYFDPEPEPRALAEDDAHRRQGTAVGVEAPLRPQIVGTGCTARHIVGMDYVKSAELLVRLREWSTQPEFVYRHQWSVGDLVIWDNTGTMHRAMPYNPDSGRLSPAPNSRAKNRSPDMSLDELAELLDREKIRDCLTRLARGEDRRNAELITGAYWPCPRRPRNLHRLIRRVPGVGGAGIAGDPRHPACARSASSTSIATPRSSRPTCWPTTG